jgi:hypothetical protein
MVRHRLSIGQKIWVLRRTFKPRGNGGALARLSSPWWCSSLPPKEVGAKMRVASTCLDGHRKLPEIVLYEGWENNEAGRDPSQASHWLSRLRSWSGARRAGATVG